MRFLVFQHIACEHPGLLRGLMRAQGIAWDTVELDEGTAIPPLEGYDALLVFGGPMNVDETRRFPWLSGEVRAIQDAVQRDMPYLGFCLGAQLLARALGAAVTKAPSPEVGVMPVTLTPAGRADRLFTGLPSELPVFQWHGDTFELPPGAVHLAASPLCPHQAFRYGRAYGLQFHVEVVPEMVQEWGEVPEYCVSLEAVRGPGAFAALRDETTAFVKTLETSCQTIFGNFVRLVGESLR
ncbi:MAG: type 1 glutamine amidotransferase [Candidatus Rokubacteria bacterium]|nr:type 1 glutamine amidotransferase [Candidatus Rokubacteria bacterium]